MARCSVEYQGRLTTELPEAVRLLMVKGDGTLLIHNDRGGKPLNWMSPPCRLVEVDIKDADSTGDDARPDAPEGTKSIWTVTNKAGEHLVVYVYEVHHDSQHDLAKIPVWSRMAWKHTCRNSWPNTWRRSVVAGLSCDVNTPPRSGPSIFCAGMTRVSRWRLRSKGAVKSMEWSSYRAIWSC